ncbi:unnamed protein product [Rhizoctonia solani]|uniref:Uncharacterized protein n=1 Tax=Rhizoctonia solani TaxID=456999 RepID=A0A8H3ARP8_9AGAM|nr:unnamed protein product [Rhizoctonia solani]
MINPRCPIYPAATPGVGSQAIDFDQFHRKVVIDKDSFYDTPQFLVSWSTLSPNHEIHEEARLVIAIVGNESDADVMANLGRWITKLYQGLDDEHGANVLQEMLVTGVFVQVFNIAKDEEVVRLVPASDKMIIGGSAFHEYMHKFSLENV